MTYFHITPQNSIWGTYESWNHGFLLSSNDSVFVEPEAFIFAQGFQSRGIYGIGTNISILVKGIVASGGCTAIELDGRAGYSNNSITVAQGAVVQGGHNGDGIAHPAVRMVSTGILTNYGGISGTIGVSFYDMYEYVETSVPKHLDNYGVITGISNSVYGSTGSDYVTNNIGAVLDGVVNLSYGDDVFVIGGRSSPVWLGPGNDRIAVQAGAIHSHEIYGEAGGDFLTGGAGRDTLSGGSGADVFFFGPAGGANYDVITDFSSTDDQICLSRDLTFAKLPVGMLQNFTYLGGTLAGAGVIYDYSTGFLYFDPDGDSGASAPWAFAKLNPYTSLSRFDFDVV